MAIDDLNVEMKNSRFRQMVKLCDRNEVDYHSVRLKLIKIQEIDKDEKEDALEKIRIEEPDMFMKLDDHFDENLEFRFY